MPTFSHPDFGLPRFADAPDARFVPAPADGVLPEDFFSTTNLPTYVRVGGEWQMPADPRMDAALVLDGDGTLAMKEMRRVRAGEPVAVGHAEDGSEGSPAFLWTARPSVGVHDYGGLWCRLWPGEGPELVAHADFHGAWLERLA